MFRAVSRGVLIYVRFKEAGNNSLSSHISVLMYFAARFHLFTLSRFGKGESYCGTRS